MPLGSCGPRPRVARFDTVAGAWQRACVVLRRVPSGGIWTLAFLTTIHAVLACAVFPYPVAQTRVRQKVLLETTGITPTLVVAGDSRAQRHVDAEVLERLIGMAPRSCANLALHTSDVASVVSWHREFAERLSPSPILLISVSDWVVGPRGSMGFALNREHYRERGVVAAIRELGIRDVVSAVLAPEGALLERVSTAPFVEAKHTPGDIGRFAGLTPRSWEPPDGGYDEYVRSMQRDGWFARSSDADQRWRQLRDNFAYLLRRGTQVVVLDTPFHPDLLRHLTGSAGGAAHQEFQTRLTDLCSELGISLLRYSAADLPVADPTTVFYDGVHLDENGARLLSELIAQDVRRLIDNKVLRLTNADRIAGA